MALYLLHKRELRLKVTSTEASVVYSNSENKWVVYFRHKSIVFLKWCVRASTQDASDYVKSQDYVLWHQREID